MKKLLVSLLGLMLIFSPGVLANTKVPAKDVTYNTADFPDPDSTTVQKAIDFIVSQPYSSNWRRTNGVLSPLFSTDDVGIGINTTDVKFQVLGDSKFQGYITATSDVFSRVSFSGNDYIDGKTDGYIKLIGAEGVANTDVRFLVDGLYPVIDSSLSNGIVVNDPLRLGQNGNSGSLLLYSELGAVDFTASVIPSASQVANTTFTLPPSNGSASEFLMTDGSGNTSWAPISGVTPSTGDVTDVGDCASGACFKSGGSGTAIYGPGGSLTFGGVDQTNNENLVADFESTANTVKISTTSGVNKIEVGTSQATAVSISGNVGVGTTDTANVALRVNGTVWVKDRVSTPTGSSAEMNFSPALGAVGFGRSTNLAGFGVNFYRGDGTTTVNHFISGAGNTYFNNSIGNFGIGTTSPTARLAVKGSGTSTGKAFSVRGSSGVEKVIIQDNGNVGIGSLSPRGPLDVGTGLIYGDGSQLINLPSGSGTVNSGNAGYITYYPSTGTTVDDLSVIYSDGTNVGIGTTTTTAKVTVSGGITASGAIGGSNLSGTNTGDQTISDATITLSDITTNDVSITKHGFAPKAPNDATRYLDGTGNYSVPAGGGGDSGWTHTGTVVHTTTSSDTVGIGTITPVGSLDVRNDEARIWTGAGTNTYATGAGDLYVEGDAEIDGTMYAGAMELTGTGDSILNLSAGNVGIGTSGPITKLQVVGTVTATEFVGGGAGLTGINTGGWINVGTDIYQSTLTNNVGVGTNTPASLLNVSSTAAVDLLRVDDNGPGDTTPFVIRSDGNVGIGTTAPADYFSVGSSSQFRVSSGGAIKVVEGNVSFELGAAALDLVNSGGAATIKNNSNTSASGLTYTGSSATNGYVEIKSTTGSGGTNDYIKFTVGSNGATEAARIIGSGNIGIGTTLPGKKLSVFDSCIQMKAPDGTLKNCCVANDNSWTCS